jgi:hypothetical protein
MGYSQPCPSRFAGILDSQNATYYIGKAHRKDRYPLFAICDHFMQE